MARTAVDGLTAAVEAFAAELLDAADAALRDVPARDVRIAGVGIRLRASAGPQAATLGPALGFHPPAEAPPAIQLLALDDAAAGGPPPRPPWGPGDYLPADAVAGTTDDGTIQAAYNLEHGVLSVYDRDRRRGVWWTRDVDRLARWDRVAPMRALLWWALRDHGLAFVHGAAVGRGSGGVLLTGVGGSGKSTTAFAAHAAGWSICGDDYCALGPGPEARALFGVGKLLPDALARVPGAASAAEPLPDGTFRAPIDPAETVPVRAIVLPRVVPGGRTRLTPAAPAAALRALGPSTTFQLPGAPAALFAATARLVREVPAYHLELWGDTGAAVEAIGSLC